MQLLDTTVRHLDQGIAVWDPSQVLRLCNARFREILGVPSEVLRPGVTTLLDLARHLVARGDFGDRTPEQVVATAISRVRDDSRLLVERRLPDGRWIESNRRVLPDGGIIIALTDISRLKAVESGLVAARDEATRARQQLTEAIQVVSEGFVLWDAQDRLVTFNSRYRDEYSFAPDLLREGVSFEEILRASAARGLVPVGYGAEEWIQERLWNHRNPRDPYLVQRRDGRWVQIADYRTREGGIVGIRTDVTRLRRSEEAARQAQARLVEALEAIPQGFVIYDPEDRIAVFNNAYRRDFTLCPDIIRPGLSFEELSRAVLARGLVQPAPADPEAWLREHVAAHRRGDRKFVARRPNRWIAVEEAKTASGHIVVIHTEITDLKRRERDLKRSRRMLQGVIDAVPAIINVKDRDSRYVLINRFQGEVWGVEPEDAVGRTSADFTGAEYGGKSREMDQAVLRSGQPLPWAEREFRGKGTPPRTWLTAKMPLRDDDGRLDHIVSVALDITRLKTTERARANLARYVAPNLVEELAKADEPFGAPRSQRVGVMFVDMVGFTRMAAAREPVEVFALLRDYHARLARTVFEHGGTLDKFTGDGIMATFGTPHPGPRDAANAIACARAIADDIAAWNAERAQPIRVGIGVHWGDALIGTIGDARRLEFAVVGDTVNIASRLESLSRDLGVTITASAAAVEAAIAAGADSAGFVARGPQALRGRAGAIDVWTYVAASPPRGT
ncbi:MAG: PAS-domain containing protein [Alphaproteobacteria bacterium]|nr:PAS-domain containing protein [Alphaproteobacteria bacterium]